MKLFGFFKFCLSYLEESLKILIRHAKYFHEDVRLQAMIALKRESFSMTDSYCCFILIYSRDLSSCCISKMRMISSFF